MGLTRLAIQRPLTILMVILGIVLMGAISYTHLRVDRLPPDCQPPDVHRISVDMLRSISCDPVGWCETVHGGQLGTLNW